MFRTTPNRRWIAPLAASLTLVGLLAFASPAQARDHDDRNDRRSHPADRHDDHGRDNDRDRDDHRDPRFRIGLNLGGPVYRAESSGHYDTRTVSVLVSEGRYDRQWVPEATEIRRDSRGRGVTVCIPGHYIDVWCPPQYETRCEQVWVADYCPAPRFSLGFRF